MRIRQLQERARNLLANIDGLNADEVDAEAFAIVEALAHVERNTITVRVHMERNIEVTGGAIVLPLVSQYGKLEIPVRGFNLEALEEDDLKNHTFEITIGFPGWVVA